MPYADELFPYFIEIARTGVRFIYHPFGLIDSVRNRVAEGVLASDEFTHILYLDSDQKHSRDIVPQLARWVIEKPERLIVAGLYFNRRAPYAPNAWAKGDDGFYYQIHKWDQGALIEGIDLVGTGCLLINKKAFDIIERPWFFFDYEGVKEKKGDFVYPGEDIGFCKKARAAGIEICLDTTVASPHACTSWVNENTYRSHCAMNEDEANEGVIEYEQFKELA
ncbi:MAG: hypothetical protein KKH95_13180 [Gammaproteobacteria bacterium]|nr:hypothetical protein [Gammaproteobacteria bacterium]